MAYSAAQADEIKVVSFNLRRDFGPQRKNRWETRKELAARLIEESNASIIGVQEFLPQMRRDLKGLLDGYSIFGRGRLSGKKPQNDEHADIIIKNKEVEVARCRTFWLSKNPDQPGAVCGLSAHLHGGGGSIKKERAAAAGVQHPL